MDLNTLWFVLITVLFTGFFLLEGFDYGVGMTLPFLSREEDRRMALRAIAPVWDGNEVWMITARRRARAARQGRQPPLAEQLRLGHRHRQRAAGAPLGRRRHEPARRHPD